MKTRIGINANNISSGGGLTHLLEFLRGVNKIKEHKVTIVVWSSKETLMKLPSYEFILKKSHILLNQNSLMSLLWQLVFLTPCCRKEKIDVLLSPGGTYSGSFHPNVSMCQNMLPFQFDQARKYKVSFTFIRLMMLRFLQSKAFKNADGLIFLSTFAKSTVEKMLRLNGQAKIISHGIPHRFFKHPRQQKDVLKSHAEEPYRLIYVSKLDVYKNQNKLIRAVSDLRASNHLNLKLKLVGPAYSRSLREYRNLKNLVDQDNKWLSYIGDVNYERLHEFYHKSDLGIFISSCENLPIILLETMAAGLPIVCSKTGPMPEILGKSAFYCDPENVNSIKQAISTAISSKTKRTTFAGQSYRTAFAYSWDKSTKLTINFLKLVAKKKN